MLTTGEMAPQFELTADDGNQVTLNDYFGKKVVIFFYPKAATPGCTTQACGFRDNYKAIAGSGGEVIGISPDLPPALEKWREKEKFPYRLLSDPDHRVAEAYGSWGERNMYGRKFMGIIRSHVVVDVDGTILDIQIKVSPKASVERALGSLAA